jgi:rubrerythrin
MINEFEVTKSKIEPRDLIGKIRKLVKVYACPRCESGQVSRGDQYCPVCETPIEFAF